MPMNHDRDLRILEKEFIEQCKQNPFVEQNIGYLLSYLNRNGCLVERRSMGQPYSNRRWLNGLTNRELSKYLINTSTIPDYDYDYDDNLVECGTIDVYTTTDGTQFYDYEEALDYETRWLAQERPDEEEEAERNGREEWNCSC